MNTKKIIISGLTLSSTLLAISPARAAIDEALMYPGINCQELVATGTTSQLSTHDFRALFNTSVATRTVICPIYDRGANFTGDVWFIDKNTIADPTCRSNVADPIDDIQRIAPQFVDASSITSLGTFVGAGSVKQAHFEGPFRNSNFSYRYYVCSLPPSTGIFNYRGIAQ